MKAYNVRVAGVLVGRIERAVESTDRHYGMIRVPGRGRLAWAWRALDGRCNSPGLYEPTRAAAVQRLMADGRPPEPPIT